MVKPSLQAINIGLEKPDQTEVRALVVELDAYLAALYPPESNHGISIESLAASHVLFAVARNAHLQILGCCALVLEAGFCEIKRLFVKPQQRGHGVAKALLAYLETAATARGCYLIRLETGISQPEALGLYVDSGYYRCLPFAGYSEDPLSLFMEKQLKRLHST